MTLITKVLPTKKAAPKKSERASPSTNSTRISRKTWSTWPKRTSSPMWCPLSRGTRARSPARNNTSNRPNTATKISQSPLTNSSQANSCGTRYSLGTKMAAPTTRGTKRWWTYTSKRFREGGIPERRSKHLMCSRGSKKIPIISKNLCSKK